MFFPWFWVSQKRNTKQSPNGMKLSWWFFLDQKKSTRLGVHVRKATRRPQGESRPRGRAHPHPCGPLVTPPTYFFRLYIVLYPKMIRGPRKHFSTAASFRTREIPSRGLFRRPTGGGFDLGGLLHQHHCLSDEAWVVYHRPTSPYLLAR